MWVVDEVYSSCGAEARWLGSAGDVNEQLWNG